MRFNIEPKEGPVRKLFRLLVFAAVLAGGWLALQHYQIEGLDQVSIRRRAEPAASPVGSWFEPDEPAPSPAVGGDSIRIASYNIQVFGQRKLGKPQVVDLLVDVVRRFDVVAIQEIRSKTQDVLPRFVARLNANGRRYDYVISEPLGRSSSKEQYAFVYDTERLDIDLSAVYTVHDPDDLLHREPFVAAFRVRGPAPNEAFTFTLINIHTDPDETVEELNALDDVFRQVRNDRRGEDDVILLGDLNVDDRSLGQLGAVSGIRWLFTGVTTNTRRTKLYDNILIHGPSTTEFRNIAGVLDVMREYNLTEAQAIQVSDHLPIWAEFDVYESGRPKRIAVKPETQQAK